MPGVKGRSGGNGKKSVVRHLAEGTYRKDRHGVSVRQEEQIVPQGEMILLPMSEEESAMVDVITRVIGHVQPRMALPLSVLAHNLALYVKIHSEVNESGVFGSDRFGCMIVSPRFKARSEILKLIHANFSTFAMSYSEQASILEIANRASKTMSKPSPGKPM